MMFDEGSAKSSQEDAWEKIWNVQRHQARERKRALVGCAARSLFDIVPQSLEIDWDSVEATVPLLSDLRGCPQDPRWHAEGDVFVHTKMVTEALVRLDEYVGLPDSEKRVLFLASLLHDIGKPATTKLESDNSITSRGHARKGAHIARDFLWRKGVDPVERERICRLVATHMQPGRLLDKRMPTLLGTRLSWTVNVRHLYALARSDALGRRCRDDMAWHEAVDNVDLFRAFMEEMDAFSQPRPMADAHTRYVYFRDDGKRDPDFSVFDDRTCQVTVLCGLPASGKDTWVEENASSSPVLSLDALRKEMGAPPGKNQGRVVQAAKEKAKELLRSRTSFVWNATNLDRDTRKSVIGLCDAYGARVDIVHLEVDPQTLIERNRARSDRVPDAVIEKMIQKWDPPTLDEAHRVTYIQDGQELALDVEPTRSVRSPAF